MKKPMSYQQEVAQRNRIEEVIAHAVKKAEGMGVNITAQVVIELANAGFEITPNKK